MAEQDQDQSRDPEVHELAIESLKLVVSAEQLLADLVRHQQALGAVLTTLDKNEGVR